MIVWLSLALFLVLGAVLVRNSRATLVTHWMLVYEISDFTSLDAVTTYVQQLRMPIPIGIALLEIGAYALTGSTALVDCGLYRIALVLAFSSALGYGAWRERVVISGLGMYVRLGVSWLIGVIFLWSTVLIHPGNPLPYDLLYPLLCMGYLLLVRTIQRMDPALHHRGRIPLTCLTAGFLLSMAELTRPFMVYMLPIVLWLTYRCFQPLPRRYFMAFMLPLILFSGTWHTYQLIAHDQVAWGNHSGFNLMRVWISVPQPPLVPEINNAPLAPGRWENINTPEHAENSRRLQTAIVRHALGNPIKSAGRVAWRVAALMSVRTSIWNYRPRSGIFPLYRASVWLLFGLLIMNILHRCGTGLRRGRRSWRGRIDTDAILLFITIASIVMLASGDAGEEARFLISVLPLLLACPLTLPWKRRQRPGQNERVPNNT